ncbi:MAG: Smr/MutS family protein [Bacteroidales bacterium]
MRFAPGSLVRVLSLSQNGEVVESSRGGRYRVRVGGVVVSCREDDLREPDKSVRRKKGTAPGGTADAERRPDVGGSQAPASLATLDLHGMTVEEALRVVEERLDAVLLAGLERLDIIHGRGSGRIKAAVHKFLREVSAVRHFAIAPDNPGVTRVRF